ncbi:MAG: hypothetical protein GXP63_03810 [DPANN group archaeon]|nr:hypothetical protein [DPANN group archaeon]
MASSELLKDYGFSEEEIEVAATEQGDWTMGKTGFPSSVRTYRLSMEAFNQSIEEAYFWMVNHLRQNAGYPTLEKITDLFSASEQSSFFGAASQRLSIQQDKVSQFLATIGKMVKELFQLVRELRIIDERLRYYRDSWSGSRSSGSAEITLKGIWIDLVEQGAKNPASVYGMARELQFITLPDLFFSVHPQNARSVDDLVDNKVEFNRKVREVLKRKLRSFLEWKQSTYKELNTRRKFTLKYLRQHYDIIHMYMSWVKPYLKNIQRLKMADKASSPDLINAFEGALIEIEILAKKLPMHLVHDEAPHTNHDVHSVLLLTFAYRTRPSMTFQQEGYHKGPSHLGRIDIGIRAYAWTKNDVKQYLKMKEKEDMELMMHIDGSVQAAMEALGGELEDYLKEAGETFDKVASPNRPVVQQRRPGVASGAAEPFIGVFKGLGELFGSLLPHGAGASADGDARPDRKKRYALGKEKKIAEAYAKKSAYQVYNDFKKDHGMLYWD